MTSMNTDEAYILMILVIKGHTTKIATACANVVDSSPQNVVDPPSCHLERLIISQDDDSMLMLGNNTIVGRTRIF